MANYSAFVIDKERKPLHTLLPLKSPLAIVIDVSSICNLRCYFCYHCYSKPQQKDDNPFMPLKLFEKITDDLRSFEEPINVITVGGQDGEPLLNPDFCRYIKILKESKTAKKVKTNTNATTLTFDLSEKLIETGIDIISISINGVDNESYCRIVNRNINFDLIRKNVEYLYSIKEKCHIHIKCIGDCFSDKEKKKFMEIFSPFSDTIFIDNMVNQWNNISLPVNDNEDVHRFNMKTGGGGGICSIPFYRFLVHTNGKVSPCFHDWNQKLIVGDAVQMSLLDIWNGDIFCKLRIGHIRTDLQDFPECANCLFEQFMTSENLSQFRDELLQKFLTN